MSNPVEKEDYLLEYVRTLEYKSNLMRGQQVQSILKSLGIEPSIQECHLLKIKNIVVDFSPDSERKILLFSAHYDAVKGSPGANDNASGVAVLLGLCRELRNVRVPIRIVFLTARKPGLEHPFCDLAF